MVDWTATVGGTTVEKVFDVRYTSGESTKIGEATIEAANTSTNRSFSSGEEVIIRKNGTVDFRGYLTGKPTKAGPNAATVELEAADKRLELKHQQVNRVFYQMDTGQIIRDAVTTTVAAKATDSSRGAPVHRGTSTTDWSATIPIFELANIDSQQLAKAGNNFLFCGFPSGTGAEQSIFKATFTGVPSSAIPDGQIEALRTRLSVNDRGQQFNIEVNLRDNAGNNYNWPLDRAGQKFDVHELRAADAVPDAEIGSALDTNGALEYRFELQGELPESRAAGLDYAYTVPFATQARETPISVAGVKDTGNVITRRVNRSVFELIKELGTEDGYYSYIDTNDVLHYHPAGQNQAPESITHSDTVVTGAEFDRDYRNIVNKVTVQGDDDIQVTLEDSQSVSFYGISPREEPIVDQKIQTDDEATRRGKGYLRKNAWDDTAITFEIADTTYQSLNIGDTITVDWPPENVSGSWTVTKLSTDTNGIVTVDLTGAEAI